MPWPREAFASDNEKRNPPFAQNKKSPPLGQRVVLSPRIYLTVTQTVARVNFVAYPRSNSPLPKIHTNIPQGNKDGGVQSHRRQPRGAGTCA